MVKKINIMFDDMEWTSQDLKIMQNHLFSTASKNIFHDVIVLVPPSHLITK
jgi:hypothetical protein